MIAVWARGVANANIRGTLVVVFMHQANSVTEFVRSDGSYACLPNWAARDRDFLHREIKNQAVVDFVEFVTDADGLRRRISHLYVNSRGSRTTGFPPDKLQLRVRLPRLHYRVLRPQHFIGIR